MRVRHPHGPPDVAAILNRLLAADVRFVVTGSVAVLLHGGVVLPGDLDIVPDMAAQNLARLASALEDLEATVAQVDFVGGWQRTPAGEWQWHQREATPQERRALLQWTPDPLDPGSFDHLLNTRFGNLDIVPAIAGPYAELNLRAAVIMYSGAAVPVVHVTDLLATLTVPRRAKDAERVRFLRALQRQGAGW